MQAHKLTVRRTAHYYTVGSAGKDIKNLWICCHGYGQAARSFVTKFADLDDSATLVVAPEGLSRFYWGGFTGDVVASWMTSGDRLDEIADFCNYMQQIYDLHVSQCAEDVRITLFGFSQGVATVLRWIFAQRPAFHNLVLWAGSIPDELDYTPYHDYLADKNIQFVYGTKDEFLTEKRMRQLRSLAAEKCLKWEESSFSGRHTVDKAALLRFREKLEKNQ